jgi:hypothetical protein
MYRLLESLQLFHKGYISTSIMEQRTNLAIFLIPIFSIFYFFSTFSLASVVTVLCGMSWPGVISKLYSLGWSNAWTLNKKIWTPTVWFISIYRSIFANLNKLVSGLIVIVGIVLPLYLGWQAFHQQTWVMRIVFGVLPTLLLLILAGAFIKFLLTDLLSALKVSVVDAFKLRRLRKAGLPLTRVELFSQWSELKSQWSKLVFVKRLEFLQEISGEWPGLPPYASNGLAESKIARLEERWRRLNR